MGCRGGNNLLACVVRESRLLTLWHAQISSFQTRWLDAVVDVPVVSRELCDQLVRVLKAEPQSASQTPIAKPPSAGYSPRPEVHHFPDASRDRVRAVGADLGTTPTPWPASANQGAVVQNVEKAVDQQAGPRVRTEEDVKRMLAALTELRSVWAERYAECQCYS